MGDKKRQQVDIRSFFGPSASKPATSSPSADDKRRESVQARAKAKPVSTSEALSEPKLKKRAPSKPKEKVVSKKGMAVTRKKPAKARQLAKKKAAPKISRKKRRRDEEEEYDSDFVTSNDSDEEMSEDELKPKKKGRTRIVCSDGESDTDLPDAELDDESKQRRLVNQSIVDFAASDGGKHHRAESKGARPVHKTQERVISSEDFFGSSTKPKLVKPSSTPSDMAVNAPALDSDAQAGCSEACGGAVVDPMSADLADAARDASLTLVESPGSILPDGDVVVSTVVGRIVLKENVAPVDAHTEGDTSTGSHDPRIPAVVQFGSKQDVAVAEPESANSVPAKKWFRGQQRQAPKLLGQKVVPKGALNCLSGKRFVVTGVLASLEREFCTDLIKSLGGAVTTAVSGKTTHLVVGDDPSQKKVDDAKRRKIEVLDEDGLFGLIASCQTVPMAAMATIEIKVAPDQVMSSEGSDARRAMWVDKYKPGTCEDLCANPSIVTKLKQFLKKWPNADEDKHAVLLSGPPGIGKSSAAAVCAKEAGFNVVELNASTTRSKKALHEHVKELLQCHSISEYFDDGVKPRKQSLHKTVLIMDEVDGMSGGDRGGMQELYSLIKTSKVPIICICNDRASPKVRTLANYCIDLRLRRPMANQVTQRLASIARREGLSVDANALTKLVESTRGDIRQMLNTMQLWRTSSRAITFDDAKSAPVKDFDNSPFDVAPALFHPISPHQSDWISKRVDAYFSDPSLIPLMLQGNYLNCIPQLTRDEAAEPEGRRQIRYLERFAKAASSISDGDLIEASIRGGQAWSLMPVHAVMSSVAPGIYVSGHLQGRIEFPQWLGKHAMFGKNTRLLSELHGHVMSKLLGASPRDLNLDYLPVLRCRIARTLATRGADGIGETVGLMNRYSLTRSDLDIILELGVPISAKVTLDSRVKASLTRALTLRSTAVFNARKGRAAPVESNPLQFGDDIAGDDSDGGMLDPEAEDKPDDVPKKLSKPKAAPASKRKSAAKAASAKSKKSRTK